MPKLKGMRFTTAIIDWYRRREASVEEAVIEMCLAGVSTRRIEDVSEALWGVSVSASAVSNLSERAFAAVEKWRGRPLGGSYPNVYVDCIYLKRSWGGSYENVAVMVAIGVNEEGYREVNGTAEGFTESSECRREFLSWLSSRGLRGVRMFTGDKAAGMVGSVAEVFPDAAYQRCTIHFNRNVQTKAPKARRAAVAAMLKAIHVMESRGGERGQGGRGGLRARVHAPRRGRQGRPRGHLTVPREDEPDARPGVAVRPGLGQRGLEGGRPQGPRRPL